jgi:16S rRNA (uracil1498-N3)-methyltransferase
MPRFFSDIDGGDITVVTGQDAVHIRRSLRLRIGDNITLCNGKGSDYFCEITGFDGDNVVVKILYQTPTVSEPSIYVTLYQGLPKGDKLEYIIQKSVELGVSSIVPVETARSISRINKTPDKILKKQQRLQKIADEAAGQSGRGILPEVQNPLSFKQAVDRLREENQPVIVFYEGGGSKLSEFLDNSIKRLSIFVGPEGGFEPQEIEQLCSLGAYKATLGPRILRCETAPIAALSVIMALTGNMD